MKNCSISFLPNFHEERGMGLSGLRKLITPEKISLDALSGKKVAFDGYITTYQFLTAIRGYDGSPLMDSQGRVTSHLSGIFYRLSALLKKNIIPIFVFDGIPPEQKKRELKRIKSMKEKKKKEYEIALEKGDYQTARLKAMESTTITSDVIESAQKLLTYMGIPWLVAPAEGEAQAAYMCMKGDVWTVGSQDYDALLFGSPRVTRNINMVGRKKLPRARKTIKIEIEHIELRNVLNSLKITREQLIDMAILMGTDYNEGIKGIGAKKAYNLIKKHGNLEEIIKVKKMEFEVDINELRNLFLNPEVSDKYDILPKKFDVDKIIDFLVGEHDFSLERVKKTCEEVIETQEKPKQSTLDKFMSF